MGTEITLNVRRRRPKVVSRPAYSHRQYPELAPRPAYSHRERRRRGILAGEKSAERLAVMQELTVIGIEEGALVASAEDGTRFRIGVDDALRSRLRQPVAAPVDAAKPSPREIQAQIRGGQSAEDIVAQTGAAIEYVRRFEAPVIAERAHILESAQAVRVLLSGEFDFTDHPTTFGTAVQDRLTALHACGVHWDSWKDEEHGWLIQLEFTVDSVTHDARWEFDPRKVSLHPVNPEAVSLSQPGELTAGMVPRLRAVSADSPDARFDSGAFSFADSDSAHRDTAPHLDGSVFARANESSSSAAPRAAIQRADEPPNNMSETADLLEALRRRRGERESADGAGLLSGGDGDARAQDRDGDHPHGGAVGESAQGWQSRNSGWTGRPPRNTGPQPAGGSVIPLVTAPQPPDSADGGWHNGSGAAESHTGPQAWNGKNTGSQGQGRGSRRSRPAMPSWDEIVFGARTDEDDPA